MMGTDNSFSNVESSESASNKLASVDAIGIIKYIVSSLEVSKLIPSPASLGVGDTLKVGGMIRERGR
ncbi:hypothetical protein J2Z47_005886 [Cohnella thailandensis]|nr:hypothetical protein [Cohnella thailandensis]